MGERGAGKHGRERILYFCAQDETLRDWICYGAWALRGGVGAAVGVDLFAAILWSERFSYAEVAGEGGGAV